MAGRHDPVAQCQVFELEGLKQRVSRHAGVLFEIAPPDIGVRLTLPTIDTSVKSVRNAV